MNPASSDYRIERYLDGLVAPLLNCGEKERIREFRDNALFHLECLVDEYVASGMERTQAVDAAIQEYGPSERTSLAMLDEWCRGTSPSPFARSSTAALWWSFGAFGLASGVSQLAFEFTVLWPGGARFEPFVRGSILIPPILAGALVGFKVPTGNLRALGLAAIPLVLHVILAWSLAGVFLPNPAPTILGAIFWLPVGALSLVYTAWLRRLRPGRRASQLKTEVLI